MNVLRGLYKAQVELAEAYKICQDERLKESIWLDYVQLDNIVNDLENSLELFNEEE
jgi:hypothetical protein